MSDSKVSNYIKDVWIILNDIEDIDVLDKGDECIVTISNHEPLDKIYCVYNKQNRFWTKEYILNLQANIKLKEVFCDGQIDLKYKNGKIQWKTNGNCEAVSKKFIDNKILTDKAEQLLDMGGKINIKFRGDEAKINVSAIPGTIIKMYIPPATHLIKPEKYEFIIIIQIIQLIISSMY